MKTLIRLVVVTGLISCVGISTARAQFFFMMDNPMKGKAMPAFEVKNIEGQTINSRKLQGRDPAIIFFWATWCPHCRAALKLMQQNEVTFKKQSVHIILVNVGEPPNVVSRYIQKNKLDFDVLLDESQQVAEDLSIVGLPTFYYVDKDGIVQDVLHQLPEDYPEILKLTSATSS